jgi:AhpD family alkylhydroperoxidase
MVTGPQRRPPPACRRSERRGEKRFSPDGWLLLFCRLPLKGAPVRRHNPYWEDTTMDFHGVEGAKNFRKLRTLKPDMFKAFVDFDHAVFNDGAIPGKMKELMAIVAAHVTQCPWCIDVHTRRASEKGATEEEIAEAVFVAMAMRAGAAFSHGAIAMHVAGEQKQAP